MKVRLVKSGIGRRKRLKKTLVALGLTRMHKEIEIDEKNKALLGMVKKVEHLVVKIK